MRIDEVLGWAGIMFGLAGVGINSGWILVELVGVLIAVIIVLCVAMGALDVFMSVISGEDNV